MNELRCARVNRLGVLGRRGFPIVLKTSQQAAQFSKRTRGPSPLGPACTFAWFPSLKRKSDNSDFGERKTRSELSVSQSIHEDKTGGGFTGTG